MQILDFSSSEAMQVDGYPRNPTKLQRVLAPVLHDRKMNLNNHNFVFWNRIHGINSYLGGYGYSICSMLMRAQFGRRLWTVARQTMSCRPGMP